MKKPARKSGLFCALVEVGSVLELRSITRSTSGGCVILFFSEHELGHVFLY